MLIHPQFDPIAIYFGPIEIRWYGLMYLVAFLIFLTLGRLRIRQSHMQIQNWRVEDLDDMLFYGVLGVLLGGRLGYVIFYKLSDYLQNPLSILKVWEGGMSFHGGFIGVLVAMYWVMRKRDQSWLMGMDMIAPLIPLGLAAGRFGNFINGELWGRVTHPTAPWAMLFPQAAQDDMLWIGAHTKSLIDLEVLQSVWIQYHGLPRHPSQLYEVALEGIVLFLILWFFALYRRPVGAVSGLFLMGYGTFRLLVEFTREPDNFLGLLLFGLSMGQWLSLPMLLAGIWMLFLAHRNPSRAIT
ncbi:prolipoprotein diacylglyceryl transferase [Candidatus Pandoraea novymonadis]|uniref:Phosphatidylglycerol--prolipoprotein diacylglyceryl transferase n=1 Tax=Candidatus Pandoraea novymonadis TaxID=1808959 RepID=A0ABX5FEW8_9BURK|nr:prolipoprotein diacylglyceryl transferase [Candidatus Pandoraea novymonadis]PSB92244.1 Prolipoprotein diacylglyceryl transferase [Candidatus Pandoraea novymonadis]